MSQGNASSPGGAAQGAPLPEAGYRSSGNLEKVLRGGHFSVTGELGPPRHADARDVREKARHLKGNVDSVNITDNQTAVVRMSSLAASVIAQEEGLEANMQMVARDRNRIAMQSDILGAAALGIRNLLVLSGDHQVFGDHPGAKNVYDLDSVNLLRAVRGMRDDGELLSGQKLPEGGRPRLFIGAAYNPFADPEEFRVLRAAKKIAAGADFLQSQCIYDMDRFKRFMARAVDMGLTEKAFFIAGVTPLKSLGMAKYMKNSVPGITMPESCIERLKGVAKEKQAEEGIRMACEQIEEFKGMAGVSGVHLMLVEWEHMVPTIVKEARLVPRPAP
ncbi:MAG: methylenetetrahydrofolate reductase [Deltaproteobacteria bacterium]|jgi:methylenetetrahydrofolate reductase (NADPH)|nr:methylenetetrahydrofolate reductase [Deltaproteobacteria bacterium]